ncbi:MAG TPA: LysR substrate-binding domain-containing protein [Hydrogenophaga sp.]|uniref:LysR family transcriptional regulator n=1 Tax=Hydrogenophaga sp. TaxID=1904254 RepID=UPI002CA80227|nr:LysR substrate-binding domain-containing protein [Hydrogenophaga sp.]HMN94199.1 LysR substrate-binding domain-containing protein [Hydrogenophaga sp.]HMP08733.1 LysR substrate-binding domain-containing protein [Hydrogenophaga sp.]
MEIRQLRYFVAIADCGSFTKAAERVYVAQSALSHQLAQLEDELGVRLFSRSRRGVELTEAGQRFLPHAVSILRQVDEAVASARHRSEALTGKVVFGIPHSASNALALPLLREVHERHPGIELELTEELTGNLLRQLRAGQIQLAVLFDDGHLDGLSVTPVLSERLCLIEPATSRPAARAALSLKQALAEPLILPAQPHGVRPIIESAAAAAGLPPPQVYADISSISILRTTLLAGLGRTLLPVMPLQAEIAAGQLRATPVTEPPLERVLTLCASAHIPRSPACQAVAELAVGLMQRLARDGHWVGARVREG